MYGGLGVFRNVLYDSYYSHEEFNVKCPLTAVGTVWNSTLQFIDMISLQRIEQRPSSHARQFTALIQQMKGESCKGKWWGSAKNL